jgi:peptidyl-prolyl cis-trans isomerase C
MKTVLTTILTSILLVACSGRASVKSVALVNGEPILADELAAALPSSADSATGSDSIRLVTLDRLIEKHLFLQEARARGLDTAFGPQLDQVRKAAVIQRLYDTITAPGNRLSEHDMQVAHELLSTEARTRVIAVRSESTARRIRSDLAGGASFESLAVRYSVHPSAVKGGDLGFTPLLFIEEPLRSRVRGLAPGQVSEPVAYDRTWQLVQLVETRPTDPPPPPLEGEFVPQFTDRLKQQRRRELAGEYLARLRSRLEYQEEGIAVLGKPAAAITEAEKDIPVVIKDGRQYVKVSRLLGIAERAPLDAEMRLYSIQREIEEDLMYEDGLALKLDQLPDVKAELERRRDDLLYESLYQQEITGRLTVSDDEILAYHQQHRDRLVEADIERIKPYVRNLVLEQKKQARHAEFATELRARARIDIDQQRLRSVTRKASTSTAGGRSPRS